MHSVTGYGVKLADLLYYHLLTKDKNHESLLLIRLKLTTCLHLWVCVLACYCSCTVSTCKYFMVQIFDGGKFWQVGVRKFWQAKFWWIWLALHTKNCWRKFLDGKILKNSKKLNFSIFSPSKFWPYGISCLRKAMTCVMTCEFTSYFTILYDSHCHLATFWIK